jgi:hypothetical protein
MDDLVFRIVLLAVALAVALAISWVLQRRSRRSARPMANPGLPPGFHYFSSPACETCREARSLLDRRLGREGFTEHEWDQDPEVFQRLGVDQVPALIVVADDGSARLYSGLLERALGAR